MKIKAFLFILFIYFLSAKVLGQGYNPFPITNATWIEYSLFDDPDLLGFAWNESPGSIL